ncbi:uncharacterized protein LOC131250804 isoform X2 [Magnolia sinica]|uniref:uncharacterized protein LOC131250804 isoform X2 n=1 Tax=Magnolia sinica TaxID=86752 RepID=UPI002659BCE9|nr:uncharacterized protein LOC131250804 isoform X2 [Magnolia sinica]XP_058107113.1 uncharacterized protein LOC131250804 isoform X2 [Magnolia sinica]XP_058107114.1 uncharacterized protein LOC131250804 isoform X2 [Magnolia sinica]XP_058107115.1 uncharacterized protein LOC131250804 isoform X2 [Magnolia sinica]XP_058107116.1 uncharacterized protein LOC131250804 isoform X2 [Magnolia sinica]XP_058107117.1 uncharacterized protein LOC131250804 isoform X2 [Magnolia sinica]XP_058107118.1 uncharacterize
MECDMESGSTTAEALTSCPKKDQIQSAVGPESTGSGDFAQPALVVGSVDPISSIEHVMSVDLTGAEIGVEPELEVIPVAPDDSKPHVGREFESKEAAIEFYNAYAKLCGFSVCLNQVKKSQKLKVMVFRAMSCSKEGKSERKFLENSDRKRAPRPITRIGCPARLEVRREAENRWVVTKFIEKHCHILTDAELDCEMSKFVRQNGLRRLFKRFINAAVKSELTFAFAMERIMRLTEELKEMAKEDALIVGHNHAPIEQVSTDMWQEPMCSSKGVCIDFGSGLALSSTDILFHDLNIMRDNVCCTNKRFKCVKELAISGKVGAGAGTGTGTGVVEGTWMLN